MERKTKLSFLFQNNKQYIYTFLLFWASIASIVETAEGAKGPRPEANPGPLIGNQALFMSQQLYQLSYIAAQIGLFMIQNMLVYISQLDIERIICQYRLKAYI